MLYGGRSSSKSWDAAGVAIALAQWTKLRFLCTRQFQNKIEESVYTLLKLTIERFGLRGQFDIQQSKIICKSTGSEFIFYGLARNIDEIKSMESVDIHWAEEAQLLTEEQWKVIDPTLRKEGSEHWIIFNPRLVTDFVWRRFVVSPPPDTLCRKINYDENPFLSNTIRRVIEGARLSDPDTFRHVYLGEPMTDDETSVIRRSWLLAALDGHKKLGIEARGARRLGFDVADAGQDACALVESIGPLSVWSDHWKAKEDELLKSCTKTWSRARDVGASIVYDAIGVGAGSGAKFNELNAEHRLHVPHAKFFAGGQPVRPDALYDRTSKVKNKDFFANVKAQAWWLVADRLRNTYNAVENGQSFGDDEMLFLDAGIPHLHKLIDELSTPKRDYDNAGRVKVESKKDLEKRDVPSPNLADAYIMANLPGEFNRRSFLG